MSRSVRDSVRVVLFGATGLVGREVLSQLIADPSVIKIDVIGRRDIETHSIKVKCHISDLESPKDILKFPADIALCCLGTTMAQAKSKEAFRHVDHDLVVNTARACSAVGIPNFGVLSSLGARIDALSYYLRVKAEMERHLRKLPFEHLVILRPSLLLGERPQRRSLEHLLQKIAPYVCPFFLGPLKRYRFIPSTLVARRLIEMTRQKKHGVSVVENENIFHSI